MYSNRGGSEGNDRGGADTGGGAPGKRTLTAGLPARLASHAGAQLGQDFSSVTVHQDGSAERLGTTAYARGDGLHFAAGAYQPGTAAGVQMIGHELAHVAQQREGRVQPTGARGGVPVNTDPGLERAADTAGAGVAQGFDLDQLLDFGASSSSGGGGGGGGSGIAQGADLAPAPAPAAAAPAAPVASTSPVPPEVLARVGAEFQHRDDVSAERHYRITAGGGFLLLGSSLEFRSDGKYKDAWATLATYVVAHQAEIPATVAAPAPAAPGAAAPAPDPWSLEGITGAIGNGLAAAGNAVVGAVQSGIALVSGGIQSVEDAIRAALGTAPAGPSAGGGDGAAPAPGQSPAPGTPAPGGDQPAAGAADIPVMSQFNWYGNGFTPLHVDDVYAAAQVIANDFAFGGPVAKVTEPTDDVRAKNPNQGYFWFKADGSPTWNGKGTGTQYVTFTIHDGETSSKVNPVSAYLAEKPPGQRPTTLAFGGKNIEVPAEVQSLNLRNIPGPRSCFATSEAMMAQAGVHAVGSDMSQGLLPITHEDYRDWTDAEIQKYPDETTRKSKIQREVTGVTCDAAAATKAKAYIDFELDHGRPVFTGITYKEAPTLNSDTRTDHWVVITARAGAGYTFNDPSDGTQQQFTWDGEKLHRPGYDSKHANYLYVASWIRPNQESLAEWNAYWAQHQSGGAPAGNPAAPAAG